MKVTYLFILILVGLLLSACGSIQSDVASKAPPDGEYRLEVSTNNFLILTLNKGHFAASSTENGPLAEGSYSVEGDKITFTEETTTDVGKSFCGSKVIYSLKWKFDKKANQLNFNADTDPCSEREQVNTSGPFAYKPLQ